MKLTICGSISFAAQMKETASYLANRGHTILLPESLEEDVSKLSSEAVAKHKVKNNLIRKHWEKIQACDAILVLNYAKNGVEGYVGGNTFLEMGFAFVLGKPIYFLYDIPAAPYRAEMLAMRPAVLKGDLGVL